MKKIFITLISAILTIAMLFAFAGCTPNENNNDNSGNGNSFSGSDDTSSDENTVSVITDIPRFSSMRKQADKIDVDYDNNNGKIIPFSITDTEEIAELMDVIFKASLYKMSEPIPPDNSTRITVYQGNRSYAFSVCYITENGNDYTISNSLLEKIMRIAWAHGVYETEED